jgi:hypothetical protein
LPITPQQTVYLNSGFAYKLAAHAYDVSNLAFSKQFGYGHARNRFHLPNRAAFRMRVPLHEAFPYLGPFTAWRYMFFAKVNVRQVVFAFIFAEVSVRVGEFYSASIAVDHPNSPLSYLLKHNQPKIH